MTPGKVSRRILIDRMAWIDQMLAEIQKLPLESYEAFTSDSRNVWAAESCLRRALEAIMDLGRHILAKKFGHGVTEYKQIGQELQREGVITQRDSKRLQILAGYRNRMVHYYHEIGTREFYEICRNNLQDVLKAKDAMIRWIKDHPDSIDNAL